MSTESGARKVEHVDSSACCRCIILCARYSYIAYRALQVGPPGGIQATGLAASGPQALHLSRSDSPFAFLANRCTYLEVDLRVLRVLRLISLLIYLSGSSITYRVYTYVHISADPVPSRGRRLRRMCQTFATTLPRIPAQPSSPAHSPEPSPAPWCGPCESSAKGHFLLDSDGPFSATANIGSKMGQHSPQHGPTEPPRWAQRANIVPKTGQASSKTSTTNMTSHGLSSLDLTRYYMT